MVRVAVIADSHFDEHNRFEECVRLHDWIASDIRARGVDAIIHTGDVYERKSTPLERQAVADWVRRVAAVAPALVVRGNHDVVDDLPLLERLATEHRVVVEQAAGVHTVGGVEIAALAWPRKAALLAASGADGKEVGDALRAVLRGLGQELRQQSGPRLFAAHAMVRGSITSTGQPLVGCDLEVGLEDLALVHADAYALGHIHKGQRWDIDGAPVVYPGSPRRTAFGELEAKGYTVLEWDAERVSVTFVEVPATPMIQLEGRWFEGQLVGLEHPSLRGAEVRLRYAVPSDRREEAAVQARAWRDRILEDAVSCKVEEVVIAETRARAPEIARAATLADKLAAYWSATGFEPGDRRGSLVSKTLELEENHAA